MQSRAWPPPRLPVLGAPERYPRLCPRASPRLNEVPVRAGSSGEGSPFAGQRRCDQGGGLELHSIWMRRPSAGRSPMTWGTFVVLPYVNHRPDGAPHMSDATKGDAPVLDLMARMTADSLQASTLDPQTLVLVRIAALVAVGAPPVSYALNLGVGGEVGLDTELVRGVLTAVAPIVGTARVAAATGNIVRALAAEMALEDLEVASEENDAGAGA